MASVATLAGELGELKRVRDASSADSLACRLFRTAWTRLVAGDDLSAVAGETTAAALVAVRLGGIDHAVLRTAGLDEAARLDVVRAAFDELRPLLPGSLSIRLRHVLSADGASPPRVEMPGFVEALIRQPRAGATSPGLPRLVLEPAETHGDHCLIVAVLGVVLSGHYGCDIETPFLAGLAHHLHNAVLPDSGFAGEVLLGPHLAPVLGALFARELAALPEPLAQRTRDALATIGDADTAHGRSFNAADVIDRVQQQRYHARAASFTLSQALDDLQLVHEGPLQAFHHAVLQQAALS